jgi:hypothetical protein
MNDPSIAVAMLGAGARSTRGVPMPARASWLAAVRRWLVARVSGAARHP